MDSSKTKSKRSTSITVGETSSNAAKTKSQPSLGWDYDVFLSFRGLDTRDTFIDYLYEDLMEARIHTFRDNDELQAGEEIGPSLMGAIKHSKIFIPIFSKGYASSKWCLQELAYMVEQKHEKQEILPVFYDMDPHDVRHQSGCYKEAFYQHKKEGTRDEIIHKWKEALQIAGKRKGLVLQNDAKGSKAKLKTLVVETISNMLKEPSLIVTDKLIGIDYQIHEVLKFLCTSTNDVKLLGLHGMAGIGKTTLAKVIYNKISSEFQCCSFLPDIRDQSQKHGIIKLQKQLISDILKGKKRKFFTEDEGIKIICHICCTKKVLIILDDVGERNQIDKLAGHVDWFGTGSRIIITTRNVDVLNSSQAYEVKELNPQNSLRLFCSHAFGRDEPLENTEIAQDIVSTTGGLPLALKVIGSYLHKQKCSTWLSTLRRLKEGPLDTVQQAFMISYEELSPQAKQVFLDIACFYIGYDTDLVSYMWENCKFCPEYEIYVLTSKSLIKINQDNTLHMHDQLRDFGRKIVSQENFSNPGDRSRLWNCEEALDVLTENTVTKNIQALSLNIKPPHIFGDEAFAELSNLRFLKLSYADLCGDFQGLLPNLRWFSWHVCNPHITPINLCLKKLVILDLSKSGIAEDWGGWSLIMEAKNLKVLNLKNCSALWRTPKFPEESTIEKIYLNNCCELREIDPSIKNLKSLEILDLRNCEVEQLPQELGSLTSLVELLLDATRINALPGSISKLTELQKLSLIDCSLLRELPASTEQLKSLRELVLRKTKIQRLPHSIGDLYDLRVFDASYTNITTLPDSIWRLKRLEVFDVSYCYLLECHVPDNLTKLPLRILRLRNTGIRSNPIELWKLYHLQELDIHGSFLTLDPLLPHSLIGFMPDNLDDPSDINTNDEAAYQVFLSFCGQDTGEGLAKLLHKSLEEAGICTFKDDEDHLRGWKMGGLVKGIEQSSVSIPIFSKNYASREKRLCELVKIAKCRENREQGILPIFFDIQPSIVQEPSNNYRKALIDHKKHFTDKSICEWEKALKEIGSCTERWVLQTDFDRNQGKLVNDVVSHVSKLLKKRKLMLPYNIIKMDDQEKKVMELLNVEANDVRIVGIYGEPGAGKTVLAKVIYNKIYKQFEKVSLLGDIAKRSQECGLECLQRQLIKEIHGEKGHDNIQNVNDGVNITRNRFGTKKVLVLLDNVDKKEQLEALARTPNWFGLGSRIIVTTRNKNVVDIPEVFGSYLCDVITLKRHLRGLLHIHFLPLKGKLSVPSSQKTS